MNAHKTIGVLTPVLDGFYFGNLLISVSEKAKEYNTKVIVFGTSANFYSQPYASDYVDGWIVIMDAVDKNFINRLRLLGKPIVGINTLLDCDHYVTVNNGEMLEEVVTHLEDHGHKQVAYVGDSYFHDAKQRYNGYLAALKNKKLKPCFYNTMELNIIEIAKKIANDKSCTAIITVNDFIATELIHHLKRFKINIPEDIAIIGFDDNPTAVSNNPSLTTIHLPVKEVGKKALTILMQVLADNSQPVSTTDVEAFTVYRESCGCTDDTTSIKKGDQAETIEYLSNMVARNFNLGQLMQSYDYHDLISMSWLIHTPFRKGLLGLRDKRLQDLVVHRFHIDPEQGTQENTKIKNIHSEGFPFYKTLHDDEFMAEENTMIVIPIMQEDIEIGAFAFVGLADITTQLSTLNTTFQLANFFSLALHRVSMYNEIQSYSRQLELVSNIIYDGIWELDLETYEIDFHGGINSTLGYPTEKSKESVPNIKKLINKQDLELVKESFSRHLHNKEPFEIECRFNIGSDDQPWMYITGQSQVDEYGNATKVLGSIKDISERKAAEKRINELAFTDTLTGLANRYYFEEQLAILLDAARSKNSGVAVLLFDLDRFKVINDSYGHQAGDRLLQYVASRVNDISKIEYLSARLGGDEFIIALPITNKESKDNAIHFGAQIVNCLSKPFIDEEREYHISCSVGMSFYPDDSHSAESLMLHADIAMYNAKALGKNQLQIYNSEINSFHYDNLKMEHHLRNALKNKEFELVYQPQIDLKTKQICGVEVLLRWNSPVLGKIKPLDFIPLAEETGLIVPIGDWVLRQACSLSKQWENVGIRSLKVAVNISSRQLNHTHFVDQVRDILYETNCNPDNLCLEITESSMLIDIEHSSTILLELIGLGVSISMDDFGTGYSSLSLLKDLPIQTLKIDKSFINDMTISSKNSSIVQAITNMAHIMSLEVVAEGVETQEQLDILNMLEIDFVQGYFISKPLNHDDLERYMSERVNVQT